MSKKKEEKVRHVSLEMADPECISKKKNHHHHQDVLTKARNKLHGLSDILKHNKQIDHPKKSMTHFSLFKHGKCKENEDSKRTALQKQNSVGAYPIKIEISSDEECRKRSSDRVNDARQTDALALERPRKKLSFREPEIMNGNSLMVNSNVFSEMKRSTSFTIGILHRQNSVEDLDLESQAMRVVRTIGQAFEVCHKLSINAPENENDHDEQETLTQDLLSDNLSDVNSDKPKKDIISEGASDKMSILPDDVSLKDGCCDKNIQHTQIEMLPPPPASNTRKSPTIFAETYASPHSDGLNSASGGSGSGSLPPAGSALSTHHELQLVREQLDQQCQQTQAAMAQLQLAREQLAAEQMARLEAQSRAHQLLVQNRELLDHIAALVAHLQGGEKSSQQNSPHVAMPQPQQQTTGQENYTEKELSSPLHQFSSYNPQGLIENRSVTSCLTGSPLLNNLPTGNIFNFPYQPPIDLLNGYPSYPFTYSQQNLPLLYSQHLLNNNNNNKFSLQNNNSPYNVRHSYPDTRIGFNNSRLSEPPQQNLFQNEQQPARISNGNRQGSMPPEMNNNREAQFIKPLSQIGTLTTTDIDGRVRVIVPVPSNSNENSASNLLANLRISDDMNKQFTGTGITRSTSEKVPNRSELMSQVQRQNWSRHTTT